MKRRLALLTILSFAMFIMLFALEPLLHDHEEGEEEHDCMVCKWLKELCSSEISYYSASVYILVLLLPMPQARSVATDPVSASSARAPPAA